MSVSPQVQEIWNLIKETQKSIQQNKESIKEMKESIKELSTETNRQIAETNKGLRKSRELFETQWRRFIESLVKGDLIKLLNGKDIDVDTCFSNVHGEYKEQNWEFDIIAVNGTEVVIVEVKSNLKVKDIEHFTKKIKSFTTWRPEYKGKTIYGAVAYLRSDEHSTKHAEKQGLFVIRATGNSASIINKKGFKPKLFS